MDQDVDEMWEQVKAMLKASPVDDPEEHAIHDYEGFHNVYISESASFDSVKHVAEFLSEHGALGAKVLTYFGNDMDEASSAMENYAGCYTSLADFAQQLTEETSKVPDHLAGYIDWSAMGRDIELNGDVLIFEMRFDEVHVFWSR